jgi:acetyl-CoA carboxylase carboxyl transferase subunit alpha
MDMNILDFEKPIFELESKIKELESFNSNQKAAINPEIRKLREKLEKLRVKIYNNLSAWQRVQIARHPDRPYTLDYIRLMMTEFMELHGDRQFADDFALIGGFAKLDTVKVLVLGHERKYYSQFWMRPSRRLSKGHAFDGISR